MRKIKPLNEFVFKKIAGNKFEYLNSDEKSMQLYWERERSLHERANMISSAEDRGEKKARIESAKNLLDILDDETISKKIGLDIELVRKLRAENK